MSFRPSSLPFQLRIEARSGALRFIESSAIVAFSKGQDPRAKVNITGPSRVFGLRTGEPLDVKHWSVSRATQLESLADAFPSVEFFKVSFDGKGFWARLKDNQDRCSPLYDLYRNLMGKTEIQLLFDVDGQKSIPLTFKIDHAVTIRASISSRPPPGANSPVAAR